MRLEDLIGRRLGRYEPRALLGRGGMAAVYRAYDTTLRRDVALKVLYPQYAGDPEFAERFLREAVLAAALEHPQIVPIYDVGESEGLPFIAMKLLPGQALDLVLRRTPLLQLPQAASIVRQIAVALDYAHSQGVIHRDIKPGNIIVDGLDDPLNEPRAVLTDLGIARSVDAPGLTATGILLGTPDFMAPEQIRHERIDGRADQYALAVVAFRMLTGRRLFEGDTEQVLYGHLNQPIPIASTLHPALPAGVDSVFARGLSKQPAERYPSCSAFAGALQQALMLQPAALAAIREGAPEPLPQALPLLEAEAPHSNGHAGAASLSGPAREQAHNLWLPLALGILLLLVVGGTLLLVLRQQSTGAAAGSPSATLAEPENTTAVASSTPNQTASALAVAVLTPGATSSPTASPSPSPEPTAAPTVLPTAAPTLAQPTALPATSPPTTLPASPTPTVSETPTATASATPTESPTASVTPEPTPCRLLEPAGGFGLIRRDNPELRTRLGCPLSARLEAPSAEQSFEDGLMFYWPPGPESLRRGEIYVLFDAGRSGNWEVFDDLFDEEDPQLTLTPTPTAFPNGYRVVRGFGLIYGQNSVRERLGAPINNEIPVNDVVLQRYVGGLMIYTPSNYSAGLNGTIFVLLNDRDEFLRFAGP